VADRLTVERSASRALAIYLQGELNLAYGSPLCVVSERWPAPDSPLPARAVTILLTGERNDDSTVEAADHIASMTPDTSDARFGLWTFMVKSCRQQLQLDVWSTDDVMRDELLFFVTDALQKGSDHTLGLGLRGGDPVRDGPILALDPTFGFAGVADFTFQGPSVQDSPDAARQCEYRAMISGSFDVSLTTQSRVAIVVPGLDFVVS
jgi:hypothetical protein